MENIKRNVNNAAFSLKAIELPVEEGNGNELIV